MKNSMSILLFIISSSFILAKAQSEPEASQVFKSKNGKVVSIAIIEENNQFIAGNGDNTYCIWDLETGEVLNTVEAHYRPVKDIIVLSPENIVSAGDRSFKFWDGQGNLLQTITGQSTDIWSMDIKGNILISGSYEKKFRAWDIETGETTHFFDGHDKSVLAVDISPNGKLIGSGSLDETVRVWDAETFEPKFTLEGHSGNIYDVEFTHDSKLLVSASLDKSIKIWDMESAGHKKTLIGHEEGVMCLAISPDDKFLVSGSFDGTIRVWDMAASKCMYTFIDHTLTINDLCFFGNENKFFSVSDDESIMLWDIGPKVISEYFYQDEFFEEYDNSPLTKPRRKSESRSDYKEREEKAQRFKESLHEKYYERYLQEHK